MSGVTVKVDDSKFQSAMERYIRDFDMAVDEVVITQHRLLSQEAVRALPPKSKSRGIKNINRSLGNAASPLNPRDWDTEPIRDMVHTQNITALEAVFQRIPRRRGWRVRRFTPDLHINTKVRGRVKKSKRIAVVPLNQWKNYQERLHNRPGLLKGSIVDGVIRFGGRAPKWITNHRAAGFTLDQRDRKNPRIITESKLSYSGRYRWAVQRLGQARKRKALGDLRRRADRAAKENGL